MKKLAYALVLAALASGCWTFNETPYPETTVLPPSATTNVTVAVQGFYAALSDYETVSSLQTVYVPGHHHHYGHYETVTTQTLVPVKRETDAFLQRARDAFERAGYNIAALQPDYTVEVNFSGPITSSADSTKTFLCELLTAFLCDYTTSRWTATLRVRDNRTGKLLLSHDYDQRYETNVIGLVPLFSIAACDETSSARVQSWCLAALTDRAVADATACLSAR